MRVPEIPLFRFSCHLFLFSSRHFSTASDSPPPQLAKAAVDRRSSSSRGYFIATAVGQRASSSLYGSWLRRQFVTPQRLIKVAVRHSAAPQPTSALHQPRVLRPNTREPRVLGHELHQEPHKSALHRPRVGGRHDWQANTQPQAKYIAGVGTPPYETYPVEPAGPSIAFSSAATRRQFNPGKPVPPSLRIDRDPTRLSPRWGSGVWSYHFPGAYAPWLLTDVPLGLGKAKKSSKDSRAVLNLPLIIQKRG